MSGWTLPAVFYLGTQIGVAIVISRPVLEQIGPGGLALLRYIVAFLFLLPMVIRGRAWPRMPLADGVVLSLLGLLQFSFTAVLLNIGLQHIPAARAALIFTAYPLVTMLLAAMLGQERLTRYKVLGVLATILGVAVALSEKLQGATTEPGWFGETAVFLAACSGAVSSVLTRPYLRRYAALPVSALALLATVISLPPLVFWEGGFARIPLITPMAWAGIVGIGVLSGISYVVWLWAIHRGSPTAVSVSLGLGPITAALLGVWFLNEPLTLSLLLGLVLSVGGLALAHIQPRSSG